MSRQPGPMNPVSPDSLAGYATTSDEEEAETQGQGQGGGGGNMTPRRNGRRPQPDATSPDSLAGIGILNLQLT